VSVIHRATAGAAWTIASGLLSRGVGVLGTLVMTRFLAPDVMGEVTTATVLAFTASWATQLGLTQYVMLRAKGGIDPIFHATVAGLVLSTIALGLVTLASPLLEDWFDTPNLAEYLPGMALAVLIRRFASVPDKLLLARMQFRTVAAAAAAGEVIYAISAVALVTTTDLGGHAIIIANIIQSTVIATVTIAACGVRDWLTPVKLRWERFREILVFGLPMGFESFLYEIARYGDKLMFTKLFGPGRTGEYSLAYNLADIPAVQVGEQVSNVLLPTLLQFEGERRKQVLVRAIGLLSLVTFPMAVGLGAVAHTLIEVLLPPKWQGVAPFLVVLAAVSVFRPINGLISQYLISIERIRDLMRLEMVRVAALFGGLLVLGQFGPVWAASAVGVAGLAHMVLLIRSVQADGEFLRGLWAVLRVPVLACALMSASVLAARHLVEGLAPHDLALLAAEIAFGALAYVAALFVFARAQLNDARDLALGLLRRRQA
jgi:lipopolysaccharide exporter